MCTIKKSWVEGERCSKMEEMIVPISVWLILQVFAP